mmetsp:Transcript_14908/g.47663  ORF Transcript_14908/g.47663 Transcript_14908/m.47663 type:complete len:223 (+) Transcript_14908:290-958(+)
MHTQHKSGSATRPSASQLMTLPCRKSIPMLAADELRLDVWHAPAGVHAARANVPLPPPVYTARTRPSLLLYHHSADVVPVGSVNVPWPVEPVQRPDRHDLPHVTLATLQSAGGPAVFGLAMAVLKYGSTSGMNSMVELWLVNAPVAKSSTPCTVRINDELLSVLYSCSSSRTWPAARRPLSEFLDSFETVHPLGGASEHALTLRVSTKMARWRRRSAAIAPT